MFFISPNVLRNVFLEMSISLIKETVNCVTYFIFSVLPMLRRKYIMCVYWLFWFGLIWCGYDCMSFIPSLIQTVKTPIGAEVGMERL